MATDQTLSVLDDQGQLQEDWDSFLRSSDNDFESNSITTTGSTAPALHCKVKRLWNLEFDSDANTTEFPAQRTHLPESILLPLASSSLSTALPALLQVFDLFGVSQNQQIPGDQGVHDQDQAGASSTPSHSLVTDIVHSFDPTQLFQIVPGGRNAVWLTPGQIFRSDVALTLGLGTDHDPALNSILTIVAQYFNINLPSAGSTTLVSDFEILLQRTCFGVRMQRNDGASTWSISRTFRSTFHIGFDPFIFWVTLEPTGLSFTITQQSADRNKFLSLVPFGPKIQAIESGILSHLEVLQLAAIKSAGPSASVSYRVLLGLKLNAATSPAFYFEYDSEFSTFTGGLIVGELKDDTDGTIYLRGFYATEDDKLLPTYDPGKAIVPVAGDTPLPYKQLYFTDIWDGLSALPSEFPTAIVLAKATVQLTSGSPIVSFSAKLVQQTQNPASTPIPIPPFTWDWMDLRLVFSTLRPDEISLSTHFTLQELPPTDRIAQLSLSLNKNGDVWTLKGHAQDLRISMLWQFFEAKARTSLLDTLGKIDIANLDITYTYASQAASNLVISGTIDIGGLEVKMTYTHNGSKWKFIFVAGASHGDATLGQILDSIVDGASGSLPGFVDGIKIPAAGADNSPIFMTVEQKENRLLFGFHVSIPHFSFSLVQIGPQDGSTPSKRLLRFAVNKIPIIPNVPLLNSLPQPFDALEYMWVDDPGTSGGWTPAEVNAINEILEPSDQVHFKPRQENNGSSTPAGQNDVVIQVGHHFLVLNKGDPVLDHVFFASKSPPPAVSEIPPEESGGGPQFTQLIHSRQQFLRRRLAERAAADTSSGPPPSSAPTKGALSFSYGPLSVTAITLQFKEQGKQQTLSLTMDATFNLDPITFSLLGFGIGLDLSGLTLDNLDSVLDNFGSVLGRLEVELHGLALSFNKPPLLIAGGFEHETQENADIYKGGVGVSFPPYTFVGLGEYAVMDGFKSVFLYAKLDGPLVTLGFATISGVRLGLGYNSAVRTPKLEEITQFPFIDDRAVAGTGNDPKKILEAMVQGNAGGQAWVTPTNNSYWFAAGLTLIAFDILTVTAVAMVQFKEAGLIISVIADAVAQMPPNVTSRSEMIVYVEIGFIAELNTVDGYFRVEAALAPTSFLLVPQCKIYGGMALVYWFSPNAHSGDWVFTVGGYHRKFQVPEWYPTVQRLGISFNLGILSVTGETYFAITPKVAMGGALIHVTLTIGPIQAWLDAGFDALVQFHPLHYLVNFYVDVGVSFNADVWFVHIHISATVGANLEVQGPQFGGTAHVDFCMFAFDIDFGASPHAPDPMNLLQFWEMLHKPGPDVKSQNQEDENPVQSFLSFDANVGDLQGPVNSQENGAALKFALEDGNYPTPTPKTSGATNGTNPTSTGAGSKWFVRGGTFKFRVSTDFAISQASVVGIDSSPDVKDHTIVISAPDTAKIYSRPMHVSTPITSVVSIKISKITNTETVIPHWRNVAPDMKLMPLAAFGSYDPNIDPSNPNAKGLSGLLDGQDATVSLIMGVLISSPPPRLALSPIAVASATAMQSFRILDFRRDPNHPDEWQIPAFELAQAKYLPAPLTAAQKDESKQDRWNRISNTWSGLATNDGLVNDPTDGVLALCRGIFSWQTNRPQAEVVETTVSDGTSIPISTPTLVPAPTPTSGSGVQGPRDTYKPWLFPGSIPRRLIKSLEDAYLDLPRVAFV